MIELPLTEKSELSPPTDADVRLPEPSTARSSVKEAGTDELILTTARLLDDGVTRFASSDMTPSRLFVIVVDRTLVSSTKSFFSSNDSPRSESDSPPIEEFSACSI